MMPTQPLMDIGARYVGDGIRFACPIVVLAAENRT
jgi:hypothetical protein